MEGRKSQGDGVSGGCGVHDGGGQDGAVDNGNHRDAPLQQLKPWVAEGALSRTKNGEVPDLAQDSP